MDDARLKAIKARADAATVGPWNAVLLGNGYRDTADQRHAGYWIPEAESLGDGECAAIPEHDALFISHAREDVPDLIAALEASRAECARLRVAIHESHIRESQWWGIKPSWISGDCRMCAALNGAADATVGSATTDEPIPGSRQAFIKAMQERG